MDHQNFTDSPLLPMDADGFPPRRLDGPVEDIVFTQPKSELTSYAEEWTRILIPEEVRAFRRPKGAVLIADGGLIEITPTGAAISALVHNARYDIESDIGEYFHHKRGGGQNKRGADQNLTLADFEPCQETALRRIRGRIAIVSIWFGGKTSTIGHLPDFIADQLDQQGADCGKIGVEIVEMRIFDDEKPKARYSVCLTDLRNVVPEPEEEDEPEPARISQEDLDQTVAARSTEPLPKFSPLMTFYFGGGALKSMTLKAAAAEVVKRGGVAKTTPGPVSNPENRFMVTGVKPTQAVETARQLGIRIITEEEFLSILAAADLSPPDNHPDLSGKTFYLTGILKSMNYARATELVCARGGAIETFPDTVAASGNTYLVAGEQAGWRADKARSMGVAVITEDEFLRILGMG